MSFDPTKPVRTRDGRKARIICTDREAEFPIVALISDHSAVESVEAFRSNGLLHIRRESDGDLINYTEPKLRPWKPEEVPIGAWIRRINCEGFFSSIIGVTRHQLMTVEDNFPDALIELDDMLPYEYSLDHGKGWHPCGVEESQ